MNAIKYLNVDMISFDDESETKQDVLLKIAGMAVGSGKTGSLREQDILDLLIKREETGSTGFDNGLAIPHCHTPGISDFILGLIIHRKGIDFHSIDGKPARIFFFIIAPEKERDRHIQMLSAISKLFLEEAIAGRLLKADTPRAALSILSSGGPLSKKFQARQQRSFFTLVVQKEDHFVNILKILTSDASCSCTVCEGQNASRYLYHLPLFASFSESGETDRFCRVITGVIDRSSVNNIVRQLNILAEKDDTGIMSVFCDAAVSTGHLDL